MNNAELLAEAAEWVRTVPPSQNEETDVIQRLMIALQQAELEVQASYWRGYMLGLAI